MKGVVLLLAGIAALATAAGTLASGAKPVIGKPKAAPAQAGKRFSVAFHVAHATGASFAVTLGGKAIRHSDSFHGGTARSTVAVPASAGGKSLRFKLTARAGSVRATKTASFVVHSVPPPELAIDDASGAEGNSGTTNLGFAVSLTHASTKTVTVNYTTQDGTAVAPGDYTKTAGTLTFAPGTTSQTIDVPVVGDTTLEPDEMFQVVLSNPTNATLNSDTGTGTITNDDTAAPTTAGSYKGATQEGNYVFFTIGGDRTVSGFSANDIAENCGDGSTLHGQVTWSGVTIPIAADGSFVAENNWSGSQQSGDITFTGEQWKITGQFATATSVTGTIALADQFMYHGASYSCSSTVTFTASRQG